MRKFILIGSIALLIACTPKQKTEFNTSWDPLIIGKASPVMLSRDTTVIYIEDYVLEEDRIDSVTTSGNLEIKIHDSTLILAGQLKTPLATLTFWSDGAGESLLLRKSNKTNYQFSYDGEGEDIRIKGEFNAWNQNNTILSRNGDKWSTEVLLNPGNYQYLYVVDGKEIRDPANKDSVDNGMGGWNSIIRLPRPHRSKLPIISTSSFSTDNIELTVSNKTEKVIAFWENYLIPDEWIETNKGSISVTIPTPATKMERSHIRIWAYNNDGVSNDVLIPLHNGKVLNDPNHITRFDKEAMIMYFLMVDRFNNGNKNNDEPVDNLEIHPKANFYGGDLAGITAKIKDGYFESLGINTVWLSPIAQNPTSAYGKYPNPPTTFSAYHGYWPISSSEVDYRFGTSEELQELIKTAHENGMNVLLDYVANHVHEQHPVYQEHPEWATNLYLPDGSLNTERWDDHRLTTWFDTFLPTLDLSKMEVVEPMTDSALFWVEKYGIDGFRHDATKHIPLVFWQVLTKKVKERVIKPKNQMVFQIGETYGSRELINSYVSTGLLDGQFDFNQYDDAVATFARNETSFSRLTSSMRESLSYYGDHNLMGYITGNQDRARFISYADESVRFDEDAKLAGWTRKIDVQDTIAYRKLSALTAYMMTIPGIPTIYYGDEYGSPGGNDPDNRRMMRFEGLSDHEKATRERAAKLISLRKNNLSLIYGDLEIIFESDDLLAIKRSYFGNHVIAVFNKSAEIKTLDLPLENGTVNFYGSLKGKTLSLLPYSFDVITYNLK